MDEWVGNLPMSCEQAVKFLIDNQMWTLTDQLPAKALERIGQYQPTHEDIDWFTKRVTERYPMTCSPNEKEQWQQFLDRRDQALQQQL
jgi:hypothetical protein